jgi:very-short-patch-repair endonuclease
MPRDKLHRIYPPTLQRSRDMRHPLTSAESKVWNHVRNHQLGPKIRRQHPIDRFIADFYCPQVKLIIEIDGDSHADPDRATYDLERTSWLQAGGYSVIRFSNDQVKNDLGKVIELIREIIRNLSEGGINPLPQPLSLTGRGEK